MKGTGRVMSVGMLTGRPEEEMSGSSGDLLQELSQMHEQARQAMRSVAKALCPSASPPGRMEELTQLFKGARRVSDYGRYRPAGKVHEKPGPW